jgi:hypothetical protein
LEVLDDGEDNTKDAFEEDMLDRTDEQISEIYWAKCRTESKTWEL